VRAAVVLCLGTGCASDEDKAKWGDALQDLRGDNMEMRHGSPTPPDQQGSLKPRDF
jgi:hypothetical protein